MARFTDSELDALKSRVDLPALIRARGVELKTHGDGHLAGKCPFHADDTPSFIVTPAKGLFHCLGCGAAGNVFQFVMKADGISFRHAVELLRGDPVKLFSPIGDGNRGRNYPRANQFSTVRAKQKVICNPNDASRLQRFRVRVFCG